MRLASVSEERRSLGEPLVDPNGLAEMERVTLEGRLEAHGDLCERFEDGAPAAAATAGLRTSGTGVLTVAAVRAARLTLVTAKATIEILGPVEVVAGSREVWPGVSFKKLSLAARVRIEDARVDGAPVTEAPAVVLRSVRSGDRVRVSGRLQRGGGPVEVDGYRGAPPWVLIPADHPTDPIQSKGMPIVFEGAPATRGAMFALVSGLHSAGGPAVLTTLVLLVGGVAAFAAVGISRRPPRPELPAGFREALATGEAREWPPDTDWSALMEAPASCGAFALRYTAALEEAKCENDADCFADVRDAYAFDLDDCAQFARCESDLDVCNRMRGARCRAGRCAARWPSPLPEK